MKNVVYKYKYTMFEIFRWIHQAKYMMINCKLFNAELKKNYISMKLCIEVQKHYIILKTTIKFIYLQSYNVPGNF